MEYVRARPKSAIFNLTNLVKNYDPYQAKYSRVLSLCERFFFHEFLLFLKSIDKEAFLLFKDEKSSFYRSFRQYAA